MYDLIVVGTGPAGAVCARRAAQAGLNVLMIERQKHPRRKLCGGALSPRTPSVLDFDIKTVVEREVCAVVIHLPSREPMFCEKRDAVGFMVKRDSFDRLLVKKAVEAGAELIEQSPVVSVEQLRHGVRVLCPGDSYRSHILVGADGTNGVVARELGIRGHWTPKTVALSIGADVPLGQHETETLMVPYDSQKHVAIEIYLKVGRCGHGYGWIFPKRNEVNIGLGCRLSDAVELRVDWLQFVNTIEDSKGCRLDTSTKTAATVPLGPPRNRLVARRAMLVGDAAGLASPVSGEGIYYALMSGLFAADAAVECVRQRDPGPVLGYQEKLQNTLIRELSMASRIAGVILRSKNGLETIFDLAAEDEVMRSLMVDFIAGTRNCSQTTMRLARRLFTYHPAKALRLGLK